MDNAMGQRLIERLVNSMIGDSLHGSAYFHVCSYGY